MYVRTYSEVSDCGSGTAIFFGGGGRKRERIQVLQPYLMMVCLKKSEAIFENRIFFIFDADFYLLTRLSSFYSI